MTAPMTSPSITALALLPLLLLGAGCATTRASDLSCDLEILVSQSSFAEALDVRVQYSFSGQRDILVLSPGPMVLRSDGLTESEMEKRVHISRERRANRSARRMQLDDDLWTSAWERLLEPKSDGTNRISPGRFRVVLTYLPGASSKRSTEWCQAYSPEFELKKESILILED